MSKEVAIKQENAPTALLKWAKHIGCSPEGKKLFSYGTDVLSSMCTPSVYMAVDTNVNNIYKRSQNNKFINYSYIHGSPINVYKIGKATKWDLCWSCNQIQKIQEQYLDVYIDQQLKLSNIFIVSARIDEERDAYWWLDKFRQHGIIENYCIKSGLKSVFVHIRPLKYKSSLLQELAIVGNGDNERGKGKGREINKFKKVARMNNYVIHKEYMNDYGAKTTYWVTSFNHDVKGRPLANYSAIFCPIPVFNNNMKYKRNRNTRLLEQCKDKLHVIPLDYFNDLLKHIPNPSTGIAFLYWVYRENSELNSNQVFGFPFFNPDVKHHYFDDFDLCYHDGGIEEKFYNEMINGQV
jgi:hypothetical protein